MWRNIFNLLSFIALVLIGIALLIAFCFKSNNDIAKAFEMIAKVLAYIVVMYYAFIYAWSRGSRRSGRHNTSQIIHLCVWAVAAVLVVIFVIL